MSALCRKRTHAVQQNVSIDHLVYLRNHTTDATGRPNSLYRVVPQFELTARSQIDQWGYTRRARESLPDGQLACLCSCTLVAAYQWAARVGTFGVSNSVLAARNW
jgi:hypothetical protein